MIVYCVFVDVEEGGIADLSFDGTQCNLVVDGGQSSVHVMGGGTT